MSAPGDLPHPLPSTVKDLLAALSLSSERRASSRRVVGEARGLGTYSVRQSARSGKFGRRQSGWQDVNAGSNPQGDFLERVGQVCRCGRNIGRGAQAQAAAIFDFPPALLWEPRGENSETGGRQAMGHKRQGQDSRHIQPTGCLVFRCFRFRVTRQKISFLISRLCSTRAFHLLSENHRRLSPPLVNG